MRKKLSVVESAGLYFGRYYANIFALNAHVKGEITASEVRLALEKLCQRRPFLAARVVTEDGADWYETEGAEPIPVIKIDRDWSEAILEYLVIPFDNRTAPQLRVLLRSHASYSDLVLIIDHAIADGLSGGYVLRDLLNYIANPEQSVTPLEDRPALEYLMPAYSLEDETPPEPAPDDTAPPAPAKPRTLFVLPWALSEAQTAALLARCREEKVTVHSALCTAFMHVFAALDPSGARTRSVSSPVSVRNRLTGPVGEQVGNYINAGVRTTLECSPDRDFWDLAREFNASFASSIDTDALLIPIARFHKLVREWYRSGELLSISESGETADYDFSLSNLGNLDFAAKIGRLELECVYGPILNSFFDENLIGVATAGGRITFSLVTRERLMDKSDALRVRELFTAILDELLAV